MGVARSPRNLFITGRHILGKSSEKVCFHDTKRLSSTYLPLGFRPPPCPSPTSSASRPWAALARGSAKHLVRLSLAPIYSCPPSSMPSQRCRSVSHTCSSSAIGVTASLTPPSMGPRFLVRRPVPPRLSAAFQDQFGSERRRDLDIHLHHLRRLRRRRSPLLLH